MSLARRVWRSARSVARRTGLASDGSTRLARDLATLLDGPLFRHWKASDVPGLQASVLLRNGDRVTRSWGLADRERKIPFDPSTVVQVMSISKTPVAAACVELARQGRVDLDAPVWQYFNDWCFPPVPADKPAFDPRGVTLRRLLCHRAGVNIHGIGWSPLGKGPVAALDLLNSRGPDNPMSPLRLLFEPGTQTKYSGAGYALVEHTLQSALRAPLPSILQAELFEPLGMKSSGFFPNPPLRARLARRYARDQHGVLQPTPLRVLACNASSSMLSTLDDLCSFARGVVDRIDDDRWRDLATPQGPIEGKRAAGLGFHLWVSRSDVTLAHRGYHSGFWHEIIVFARRKVAIVVVCNGDAEERVAKPVSVALRHFVMDRALT